MIVIHIITTSKCSSSFKLFHRSFVGILIISKQGVHKISAVPKGQLAHVLLFTNTLSIIRQQQSPFQIHLIQRNRYFYKGYDGNKASDNMGNGGI